MVLVEKLILDFSIYSGTVSFIGGFLGGDSVVVFLSGLAGQGLMPLWKVLLFLLIGTIASDLLVFLFSKTRYFKKIVRSKSIKKGYEDLVKKIDLFFHNKILLVLVIAKFLYGTRFITLFYLGEKGISPKRFVWYDTITTAIWVIVMGAVGWLAGKGLANFVSILDNIKLGLALLVALVLIIYLLQRLFNKLFYDKIDASPPLTKL